MTLLTKTKYGKIKKIILIGAGEGGILIANYILNHIELNYNILAFIDDDVKKIRTDYLGIPILGPIKNLKEIIRSREVDEIIITIPSASGELIRIIFQECKDLPIKIKILPSSFEELKLLERGKAGFKDIRELNIEDFFRRKPSIPNLKEIKKYFEGKTILVTGGEGSIGSELCKQLISFNISKLISLDHAESPMHELSLNLDSQKFYPIIGDIKDKEKLSRIMKCYNPSIIFHTAAYKHVPMMESHPDEAIKNNIFGTKNLIEIAEKNNIEDFILISTDKAVNPTSIMGASKRLTELMIQDKEDSKTKFKAIRFGNVINSQGSVIPLFKKQIESGGPITITHKDIERFFMTIPEAVNLIIQAPILGKNGDILVLDMGKPKKILEIAKDMIELEGYIPEKDIEIKFIGLRPGEKLYEELSNFKENISKTKNPKIFKVNTNTIDKLKLNNVLNDLEFLTNPKDIINKLKMIIPNFKEDTESTFLNYNLPSIDQEEIDEVIDTLKNGWITMGPKTLQFEKNLAKYIGVKHAIALNSCTAGLHLALIVLGIKKDDEVILSPFTFASTGNVIAHLKAKPVFVDIKKDTFNIDPEKIEFAITSKTKAIIIVHYAGQSAEIERIKKIAEKYNIKIIEDAAHAIGSEYNGKKIGSFGNLTSYSFYATKNITTGEGGALVTNDDEIANKLRILRLHGISKDAWKRYSEEGSWFYQIEEDGWKYNMTDINASLGIHQLNKLERFIKKRRELAEIYNKELLKIKGIKIPYIKQNIRHVYHLYPILLEKYDRNKFIKEMKEKGIGTSVHFIPLHLHPFYQNKYGYKKGDLPVTEEVYKKIVSLPLYTRMSQKEIYRVINSIKEILKEHSKENATKAYPEKEL